MPYAAVPCSREDVCTPIPRQYQNDTNTSHFERKYAPADAHLWRWSRRQRWHRNCPTGRESPLAAELKGRGNMPRKPAMTAQFWGVRGSIPSPGTTTVRYGGNTSCVSVEMGKKHRLVLDAGTGI